MLRPNVEGSLFCHMNNQNLTRYKFSKMLRNALAFTGYSLDEFNTHSLRIGAATQSFLNGMDEKTIMANG
jgi:site-specific recombinase XerD